MSSDPPFLLVIGIGNPYRSDDGAGIAVAKQFADQAPPGVKVIEESGEGTALIEAWKGAPSVILIDAIQSGAPPGTIHRLDANAEKIPARFFRHSTHAFRVTEAVELARTLHQLPPRLIIYGIEGQNFAAGDQLSPHVQNAMGALVCELLAKAQQPF